MAIAAAQPLHPLYELFAKGIYGYFGGTKTAVIDQLKIAGYSIDKEFNDPNTSFQALGLIYKDGTRPPVLVSQGTTDAKDAVDDANPKGVGFDQFTANKVAVKDWLTSIIADKIKNPGGLKVDLTGHSLGAGLAQWFASEYPNLLREAVTFQSPGITKTASTNFLNNGGNANQITHYAVNGDIVSLGGEAFLPGTLKLADYQTAAIDPEKYNIKHLAGILNTTIPGFTDQTASTLLSTTLSQFNDPAFNFTGQDWQDFVSRIKVGSSLLSKVVETRAGAEIARVTSGSFSNLIGTINNALTNATIAIEPIPPNFFPTSLVGAIGTKSQNLPESRTIDLTNFANQVLKADITTKGDAAYLNNIGFYAVKDALTGLIDLGNGITLKPGDADYAKAAVTSAIANSFQLAKNDRKANLDVPGGGVYAPIVIAQGSLADFISKNPTNSGDGNQIHAYFNYLGANPDKFSHFRLDNPNTFAVEDMFGGGDKDFNDLIVNMNVRIV
jgi:pimeloyl-ACP methyl ester carboxylesterase